MLIFQSKLLTAAPEMMAGNFNPEPPEAEEVSSWAKVGEIMGLPLLHSRDEYAMLDRSGEVCYFSQLDDFMLRVDGDLKRGATQRVVYRTLSAPKGLPQAVVFNFILKKWDFLLTDNVHTEDGKRFWEGLMAQAVAKGLRVGRVSTSGQSSIQWCEGDFKTWLNSNQDAWGEWKPNAFKPKSKERFIITK